MCLKSNETGAIKFLITTELQINIIPFKVVPLGSHTPPETLLPLPVAVLEVFMWKCSQLVCQRHFGCCPQFQNDDLWGGIWVSGKGRGQTDADQASTGAAEPQEYPFLVKNSLMERAVWQGALSWWSIQVPAISGRTRWTLILSRSRTSR